jgi:hypothetical protein
MNQRKHTQNQQTYQKNNIICSGYKPSMWINSTFYR